MKIKQQKNLRKHTRLSVTYMKKREWEKRQKSLTVKFKAKTIITSKKPPLAAKCAAWCLSLSNAFTSPPLSNMPRTISSTPSLDASIRAVRPVDWT